jgi:hypothetical protein
MPLDIPMPWIREPDTLGALSAGASAGNAAARTAISHDEETARLAQDAAHLNASVNEESARLSQAERLAVMEAAARKEIAQQNQLREQQQLAIEQAYHTAQIGLAKGRLDEQKMLADAKGREAALRLQRESQFGAAIAGGMSVMDAYKQFPVPPSVVNAFVRAQKENPSGPVIREGKYPLIEYDPTTRGARTIYTPPERAATTKTKTAAPDPLLGTALNFKGSNPSNASQPSYTPKDKLVRAHALSIAHPDWTKQQIIDAVNKEMP